MSATRVHQVENSIGPASETNHAGRPGIGNRELRQFHPRISVATVVENCLDLPVVNERSPVPIWSHDRPDEYDAAHT